MKTNISTNPININQARQSIAPARRPSGRPGRVNAELPTASRAPWSVAKLAFLCLLAACWLAIPAHAGVVTSLADDGSAGTLRAVIDAASPGDTIGFDVTGIITLTNGEFWGLFIDKDLTIAGPGAAQLAVNGNAVNTVFGILSNTVTIAGLTITNGYPGIISEGATVTVSNCTVSGNVGGGIWNFGNFFVGATSLTVVNSTISGNSEPYHYGGGIQNNAYGASATVTVANSTISGNSSIDGGGIGNLAEGDDSSASLTVTNSTISGNVATNWGGSIFNLALPGGSGTLNSAKVTLANSTLSGNSATNEGGGIYNVAPNGGLNFFATLTVANSTISSNSARNGGGIRSWGAATLEIGSTILKARAGVNISNGGIATSAGYNLSSDFGGGVLNQATDLKNTNPMLGPLQFNGGPTRCCAAARPLTAARTSSPWPPTSAERVSPARSARPPTSAQLRFAHSR